MSDQQAANARRKALMSIFWQTGPRVPEIMPSLQSGKKSPRGIGLDAGSKGPSGRSRRQGDKSQ